MKQIAKQQGQSTVEFAMVLPLFLFLVCAIMGFGIVLFDYLSVNEIARELARTMAVSSTNTTNPNPMITNINTRLAGMNNVYIAVQCNDATIQANLTTLLGQMTNVLPNNKKVDILSTLPTSDIQVTVTVAPRFIIPLMSALLPANIFSGLVVMRMES